MRAWFALIELVDSGTLSHYFSNRTSEMASVETDLKSYCQQVAEAAKRASRELVALDTETKNRWLRESAAALRAATGALLVANERDLEAAPGFGLTPAQTDRLRLDQDRIDGIAAALEQVADLDDPIGEILETTNRPNGLKIEKTRVPLGVVFFIYESRPNVTADAGAICVKSGNAVILRGGKEAAHSSRAIVETMQMVAAKVGLPEAAVQLVETTDREAVGHFLGMSELIDLAIPRGGEGLIRRVASEATMPVIKHFTGNCHVYVDASADLDAAHDIVINGKTQRMGVCNATESVLVHSDVAGSFLPRVCESLAKHDVEIRGDEKVCDLVTNAKPLGPDDHGMEYLGPIVSVSLVNDVAGAIDHINQYGSGHTDAIIASDAGAIDTFTTKVDSSAVMVNASTRFNDGGEFGMGAEIGISTDKFHARGPCGLRELTSYKYVVRGSGQVRE